MRLHPRYSLCRQATRDISEAIWEIMKKHNITYLETLRAISECENEITKFMLRIERYPDDPDHKADEA